MLLYKQRGLASFVELLNLHPMKPLFLLLILSMTAGFVRATTIYYVKPASSGTGAGTSWANAMGTTQLQAAINAVSAAGGGQVWVAAGTYEPVWNPGSTTATPTSQDDAFTLANNVAVYGGFAGTETLLSQRNYSTNVTTLSGDINTAGTYTDDCYHVVVSIANNNTAVLDGFTIAYGYATVGTQFTYLGVQFYRNVGGGLFVENSQPQLNNCKFISNQATQGGAVYNYNPSSPPVFTGCTFSNNTALITTTGNGGGAICNANGTYLTLASCTFSGNSSSGDAGALYSNNTCIVTLTGCAFSGNTAAFNGGAIVNTASSQATLTNCTFSSNTSNGAGSSNGGGAVYNASTNLFSATGCNFSSNVAAYNGGAIFFNGGSSSPMATCAFTSNSAIYGGAICFLSGSNQTITSSTFASNSATYGGGSYNSSSSYTYISCTFRSNSATAASGKAGGGELNDNSANGILLHCLFLNNTATGDGGGQYNNNANAIDSECVFNANVAGGSGGGLVDNGGNPKAYNCVLTDNSASAYGGGFYNASGNASFYNCTVYNNSANGAGGYGDGIYVAAGSPKIYEAIVWSRSNASSIGLVYAAGATQKVQFSDIQNAVFTGGSNSNNISSAPSFGNAGNYAGPDGIWATADDGLHLTGGAATDVVTTAQTSAGNATTYDITMAARPNPGPLADMGAYEGPGTFVALALQFYDATAVAAGEHRVDVGWDVNEVGTGASFQVEHSADGVNFVAIGTVAGIPGEDHYRFADGNPDAGTNYYRIKAIPSGGEGVLVSEVMEIGFVAGPDGGISLRSVLPGSVLLYVAGSQEGTVSLSLIDAAGRTYFSRQAILSAGDNYLPIRLPTLARGVYYLTVRTAEGCKAVGFIPN